jgi:hypothetical protein
MFFYRCEAGDFSIIPDSGRWHTLFQEELLGSYATPEQAAFDLSVGHVFEVPGGIDLKKLGIPKDLLLWEHRD